MGNGMISRKLIHYLSTQDDLSNTLVMVMWSGSDRYEVFFDYEKDILPDFTSTNHIDNTGRWSMLSGGKVSNSTWCKRYYRDYYSYWQGKVTTYEHILRTQWYLKSRNIDYVMLTFMDEVLKEEDKHPQLAHFWDMFDHSKFIRPGHYDYNMNSRIPFGKDSHGDTDYHPVPEMSRLYTQDVILPYLRAEKFLPE